MTTVLSPETRPSPLLFEESSFEQITTALAAVSFTLLHCPAQTAVNPDFSLNTLRCNLLEWLEYPSTEPLYEDDEDYAGGNQRPLAFEWPTLACLDNLPMRTALAYLGNKDEECLTYENGGMYSAYALHIAHARYMLAASIEQ